MSFAKAGMHSRDLHHQQDDWDEVHNQLLAIQKKSLEVSNPNDANEKEADEVARKVVDGESAEIHGTGGTINRKGEGTAETTPEFQSKLESSKGSGQSLDSSTKGEMESKMGADFSGVKIHTGSESDKMNESVNAKAFTHGQDIYFKEGNFNTDSKSGKELLAHELTHTVQQGKGISRVIQRDAVGPVASYQHETKVLSKDSYEGQYASYWQGLVEKFFLTTKGEDTKKRLIEKPVENEELMYTIWKERPNQAAYPDMNATSYVWSIPLPAKGGFAYEPEEEEKHVAAMSIDKSLSFKIQEKDKESGKDKEPYDVTYRVLYTPGGRNGIGISQMPSLTIDFISDSSKKFTDAGALTSMGTPNTDIDYWVTANPDGGGASGERGEWRYADSYPKSAKGRKYNQYEYFKTEEGRKAEKEIKRFLYNKNTGIKNSTTLKDGEPIFIKELIIAGGQKFYIDATVWKRGTGFPDFSSVYILKLAQPQSAISGEAFEKDSIDALILLNTIEKSEVQLNIIGADKIDDPYERSTAKYFAYSLTVEKSIPFVGGSGMHLRDTEVDRIITVLYPQKGKEPEKKELYYTFIIGKEDPTTHVLNVEIKRIGIKGEKGFEDPGKLRIQDTVGYPAGQIVSVIQEWIIKRYGNTIQLSEIQGTSEKEVCDNTNILLEDRAGKADWFKSNYGIIIKNTTEAATEMKDELGYNDPAKPSAYYVFDTKQGKDVEATSTTPGATKVADETAGTKDFKDFELKLLEQSLQKMGSAFLTLLDGTIFCRQEKCLLPGKFDGPGGMTSPRKSGHSNVTIYNNAYMQSQVFVGGEKDVSPAWTWAFTHELGHVVANTLSKGATSKNQDYEKMFNTFITTIRGKGNPIKPPTEYANKKTESSSPESEFFPEAFVLYLHDPDWLAKNQPEVYLWFKWIETKGTAPEFAAIQKEVQQKVINGVLTGY